MSASYLAILTGSGLLVGLLAFGGVYLDTGRRGLSGARRLLPAIGVGSSCFGGFLVPYVFGAPVRYAYFQLVKSRPIATTPYEWLVVSVATGLLISAVVVGSYLVGTRYARPGATADAPR